MANPFHAIRQFERFIFRGVPEHPEPMCQREINAYASDRDTGKSQLSKRPVAFEKGKDRLVARIIYQPGLKKIKVIRKIDKILR